MSSGVRALAWLVERSLKDASTESSAGREASNVRGALEVGCNYSRDPDSSGPWDVHTPGIDRPRALHSHGLKLWCALSRLAYVLCTSVQTRGVHTRAECEHKGLCSVSTSVGAAHANTVGCGSSFFSCNLAAGRLMEDFVWSLGPCESVVQKQKRPSSSRVLPGVRQAPPEHRWLGSLRNVSSVASMGRPCRPREAFENPAGLAGTPHIKGIKTQPFVAGICTVHGAFIRGRFAATMPF